MKAFAGIPMAEKICVWDYINDMPLYCGASVAKAAFLLEPGTVYAKHHAADRAIAIAKVRADKAKATLRLRRTHATGSDQATEDRDMAARRAMSLGLRSIRGMDRQSNRDRARQGHDELQDLVDSPETHSATREEAARRAAGDAADREVSP